MDNETKFKALCANVQELRKMDKEAFAEHEAAQAKWKKINSDLTEANKVLDTFVANWRNEETAVK